jgi:dethiobiotin synthetase
MTLGIFVAGTDTEIGKTWVTRRLAAAARAMGRRVAVCKPVAAGAIATAAGPRNDDALALIEAAGSDAPYELVNPWCLELPASPHLAARAAGVRITLEPILEATTALARGADLMLVEGAGGWLAPIDDERTMADVALALGLPVVLVVGLRLGCLNHAMLSAAAIRSAGLEFAGWVGNRVDPGFALCEQNLETLEMRLGSAPLAVFGHGGDPGDDRVAAAAVQELDRRLLRRGGSAQTQ